MRKIIIVIAAFFSFTIGSSQSIDLAELFNSNEFLKASEIISNYGDFEVSDVTRGKIDGTKGEYLMIPIKKEGKLTGLLEITQLSARGFLPGNAIFALSFQDRLNFDSETGNGIVIFYDLNYNNFKHSIVNLEKRIAVKWQYFEMSDSEKKQYSGLKRSHAGSGRHFCDTNNNGNVSFFECYRCIKNAIEANGFSSFICDFASTNCFTSTTAACLYIAAAY